MISATISMATGQAPVSAKAIAPALQLPAATVQEAAATAEETTMAEAQAIIITTRRAAQGIQETATMEATEETAGTIQEATIRATITAEAAEETAEILEA